MTLSLPKLPINRIASFFNQHAYAVMLVLLSLVSLIAIYYYSQVVHLNLAYNDARSHLNISRRVVEGLKPGLAQLGSVWLPLPHILMLATVWNDYMWHSGFAGTVPSAISFVITGYVIMKMLEHFEVGWKGRLLGVLVFVTNVNILYLQTTAMTELLLLCTMTIGVYELLLWYEKGAVPSLVKASLWIMLSTLVRYDGWFLLFWATCLVFFKAFKDGGYKKAEGMFFFFCTLAALGVVLWFGWNLVIFGDPLYFAFGAFSAHTQQAQLDEAGVLATKHDLWLSVKMYWYALVYNSTLFVVILGFLGQVRLWFDKKVSSDKKIAASALLAPLVFNIIALYFGHSVLFIQGISGDTWFNVRYGIMLLPSLAIFSGFLFDRIKAFRALIFGLFLFSAVIHLATGDAVTIDDGRVGSSQKNVSEVSGWLQEHAQDEEGYVLVSAASHDAIIFSSGLPMKRFIHEGTGAYWESATTTPDHWARWIIMRTHDENDLTYRLVSKAPGLAHYQLVDSFPFADIYELEPEYLDRLQTAQEQE